MTESKLRDSVGLLLIISHFVVIMVIIVLTLFLERFTFDEMTTAIALILPMFAVYTTVIIKHIIGNRENVNAAPKTVTRNFAFISFFLPILFILAILLIVLSRSEKKGFENFEQFKITLGIIESVFAIYVGQIINSLFKSKTN